MSNRDELAELIWQNTDGVDEGAPDVAADKIIAAGWRKISVDSAVSEDAVEAAAKVLAYSDDARWAQMPAHLKEAHVRITRKALEAAAPHIQASAWDEGYMFSYDQERGGNGIGPIPVPEHLAEDLPHWNPYRK